MFGFYPLHSRMWCADRLSDRYVAVDVAHDRCEAILEVGVQSLDQIVEASLSHELVADLKLPLFLSSMPK